MPEWHQLGMACAPFCLLRLGRKFSSTEATRASVVATLKSSSKCPHDLKKGHALIIKSGSRCDDFVVGNFVASCGVLGLMDYAQEVFEEMPEPNGFVWNTMIRGFQRNGRPLDALVFFRRMRYVGLQPDRFTLPFVVRSSGGLLEAWCGKGFHGCVFKFGLEFDVFVQSSLVEMYVQFGDIGMARQVFNEMPERDSVAWTILIAGYVNRCGDMDAARRLFDQMPEKDIVVLNVMIGGYVKLGDMDAANEMFSKIATKDLLMCNTMMGGYVKNWDVGAAYRLFVEMTERDMVTWNTMIGGFIQTGRFKEATELFHRMQTENLRPNDVTIVGMLKACSQVGALDMGRWLHAYVDRNRYLGNVVVGTSLVDMYCKCGVLECAEQIFDQLHDKDVTAWNAMITGFAMHGKSVKALELFHQMQHKRIQPNEVTFVGVICSCTHGGLVDEGKQYFHSMVNEFGLTPQLEHYGCMVDLLGRAGLLEEAYDFIKGMPLAPHTGVWGALLGACKIHGNIELAECAIKHLIELDKEDGGYCAILSNIYAKAGRWDDVAKVRALMKERGIEKKPGCSSIEVDGKVHEFGVGDKTHPRSEEIYTMLKEISRRLTMHGYVARTSENAVEVCSSIDVHVQDRGSQGHQAMVYGEEAGLMMEVQIMAEDIVAKLTRARAKNSITDLPPSESEHRFSIHHSSNDNV
ncbi:Pentatricopeptide repeat-containing protein [Nymphaea thermarum]|nr:Pentatricopeptide repeat-containing protein [Nymphaea thermarum]